MTYAIVGSGNVGTALASQFARNAIDVSIANSRDASSLTALANGLGPAVTAVPLQEALDADTVILAVPFAAHPAIAAARADWNGKIVVDATNFREPSLAPLGGSQSSDFVARALPGAKVVKTFNQLPAALLARDPVTDHGRRVLFVAGDHDDANAEVSSLVAALGFAPIVLGRLREGGSLLRYRGPLVLQDLIRIER